MNKQFVGLFSVLALVLIVLSSFIMYNQWPLLSGKTVILDTRPVDPFDPFRGQYMVIAYEVSTVEASGDFEEGDRVYVALDEDPEGISRPQGVSQAKPQRGDFISGIVTSVSGNRLNVEYGIEQYFFERHASLPTTNITIEVGLAASGRGKIVQMLFNGEPIEIEYEEFDIKR